MSEWQPIETAPKDGSTILIYGDNEVSVVFWEVRRTLGAWRCTGYGDLAFEDDGSPYSPPSRLIPQNPTHWMPLPVPPGEEK